MPRVFGETDARDQSPQATVVSSLQAQRTLPKTEPNAMKKADNVSMRHPSAAAVPELFTGEKPLLTSRFA